MFSLLQSCVGGEVRFLSFSMHRTHPPQARSMIVKRAESIGIDWDAAMRERQQQVRA